MNKSEALKNMTDKQQKEVAILMQLGDSLELAIKTVLSKKECSSEMYYQAYCI